MPLLSWTAQLASLGRRSSPGVVQKGDLQEAREGNLCWAVVCTSLEGCIKASSCVVDCSSADVHADGFNVPE